MKQSPLEYFSQNSPIETTNGCKSVFKDWLKQLKIFLKLLLFFKTVQSTLRDLGTKTLPGCGVQPKMVLKYIF